jgi:hypothetical protein
MPKRRRASDRSEAKPAVYRMRSRLLIPGFLPLTDEFT